MSSGSTLRHRFGCFGGVLAAAAIVACSAGAADGADTDDDHSGEGTATDEAAATVRPLYVDDGSLDDDDLRRLCVPPSIMMHSKDSVRHKTLLDWLTTNHYATMTYPDYVEVLEGRKARPRKAIILSLDDVTPAYINEGFRKIVSRTHEAGHVLSVAMNPQVPTTTSVAGWDLAREWRDQGSSMEDHGTLHLSLAYARSASAVMTCEEHAGEDATLGTLQQNEAHASTLEFLLGKSACRIGAATGKKPSAMILPFGLPRYAEQDPGAPVEQTSRYPDVAAKANAHGMKLIVGIPGGRVIERVKAGPQGVKVPEYPAFVGRVDVVYAADHPEREIAKWYRYPSIPGRPAANLIDRCAALFPEYRE